MSDFQPGDLVRITGESIFKHWTGYVTEVVPLDPVDSVYVQVGNIEGPMRYRSDELVVLLRANT